MNGKGTEAADRKAKIVLESAGLEIAESFYCGVLGWEREAAKPPGGGKGHAWLLMPDGELALLVDSDKAGKGEVGTDQEAGASRIKPGDRFYIRITEAYGSLDPLKRRAEAVRAVDGDELEPNCWRTLSLRTPEGYKIAYWQEFEASEEDIVAMYAAGPDRLEAALAGLNEDGLDEAIAPGKWTIRQQVLHLVDLELAAAHKLKYIVADPEPGRAYVSSRFGQDAWAEGMRYDRRPIATEVALFRLLREHILIVCSHIPGALHRSVVVGGGRTETALRLMKSMAGHANAHIRRIADIRAKRC
jgi:catechol 2,3-dioxygenase-like lactoylglutathione lyase family enzyme